MSKKRNLSRLQRVLRAAEYGYPTPADADIEANFPPQVRILYRDHTGDTKAKLLLWKRPLTYEALSQWMEDYLERARKGYIPEGFTSAPLPHCARIYRIPSKILVEWPKDYRAPVFSSD